MATFETNTTLYPQSSLDNWNFRSYHMGVDQGGVNTNAITPENFLVCSGPARLEQLGTDFSTKVFPLGMLDSVSISQQKMLQQVREIGSRRSYVISSYAMGNMAISRIMYSQASLLRVLSIAKGDLENIDNPAGAGNSNAFTGNNVPTATASRDFWINLQSEVFDRPQGLLFYILDQRNLPYGAFYAEEAQIQNHNIGFSAQGISIMEQCSLIFDRLVPVAVSATP